MVDKLLFENAVKLFLDKTNYARNQIKVIKETKNGFTNKSFLIKTSDGLSFQVRLGDNPKLNRQNELLIYKSLNIPVIYFSVENGDMIRQWVEGKTFKRWSYEKIDAVVAKMKKIHEIKNDKILKFNAFVFTDLLSKNDLENEIYKQYIQLVAKYNEYDTVCHCDLNPQNILYDKKNKNLFIIDFEWTRWNSKYFELANLARESMKKKQIIYLADAYGGIDLNKLKDYLIISCLYAYQWTLSVPNTKPIIKYRKNVLKRWRFVSSLDFSDADTIRNKLPMHKCVIVDDESKENQKEKQDTNFLKFKDCSEGVKFKQTKGIDFEIENDDAATMHCHKHKSIHCLCSKNNKSNKKHFAKKDIKKTNDEDNSKVSQSKESKDNLEVKQNQDQIISNELFLKQKDQKEDLKHKI